MRWALEFNLSLFLIRSANAKWELTHSGKFRKVDKVFILRDLPDADGVDGEVLLTFSQGGKRDYSLTPDEGGSFFICVHEASNRSRRLKAPPIENDPFVKGANGQRESQDM